MRRLPAARAAALSSTWRSRCAFTRADRARLLACAHLFAQVVEPLELVSPAFVLMPPRARALIHTALVRLLPLLRARAARTCTADRQHRHAARPCGRSGRAVIPLATLPPRAHTRCRSLLAAATWRVETCVLF